MRTISTYNQVVGIFASLVFAIGCSESPSLEAAKENTSKPIPTTTPKTFVTPALTTSASSPTSAAFSVVVNFGGDVTDFTLGDITVSNGTASNLSGGPSLYVFTVSPTAIGSVDVSLSAGVVKDINNEDNLASNVLSVIYTVSGPSAPSGLALQSPSISPGNDTTPTITVSGVTSGDTVRLFSDSTCTTQLSSGVAGSTSINLTTIALSQGSYSFYANTTDSSSNVSNCSTATVAYVLDTAAPTSPSGLALQSPTSSPGSDTTPTITVSGVVSGDTVKMYTDLSCTFLVASGTASGTTINLTSSALTEATFNFYATATDTAGNTSACSTATVAYVLDTTPPSTPNALSLLSPASSPSNDDTPTVRISGVMSGDYVYMYTDSSCSAGNLISSGTASGTTIDLTSSALSEATYNFYANSTDTAGNVSACSSATVSYQYQNLLPLGSFSISGVTGTSPDSTLDAVLGNGNVPTVSWSSSTDATSYELTIYASDGTTIICGPISNAATSYAVSTSDCGGVGLSSGSTYKIKVTAKASGHIDQDASNALYSFYVNTPPLAVNDGPVRLMKNSASVTLEVLTASDNTTRGTSADSDVDSGDSISITSVTQGSNGGIVTFSSSNVTYTVPSASFTGVDTFTYTISDSYGVTETATVTMHIFDTYTWTGKISSNWNVNGNWCGTITNNACNGTSGYPSSSSTTTHNAIFDGTCGATGHNCNVNINTNSQTYSLYLNTGYSGALNQVGANTLTVGVGGYSQSSGSFIGGSGNLVINGQFQLISGSFTSTSGILQIIKTVNTSSTFSFFSQLNGSTFIHNNGTLKFKGIAASCGALTSIYTIDIDGTLELYNFESESPGTSCVSHVFLNVASGDKIVINNDLTHNGGFLAGDWELKGNISIGTNAPGGMTTNLAALASISHTSVKLTGSGTQTYSFTSGNGSGNLIIEKASGDVEPAVGTSNLTLSGLFINQGTFYAPTGTLTISRVAYNNTINTTLNVDLITCSSSGSFIHNNGTVTTYLVQPTGCGSSGTVAFLINPDTSFDFYNFTISPRSSGCYTGASHVNIPNGKFLTVNGNFNHSAQVLVGNLELKGNLTVGTSAQHSNDTGSITMNGNSDQYYFSSATGMTEALVIDKSSGLILPDISTTDLNIGGLRILQGSFTAPTGTLKIGSSASSTNTINTRNLFLIQSGASFFHNNGTVSLLSSRHSSSVAITDVVDVDSQVTLNNLNFNLFSSGSSNTVQISSGDKLVCLGNVSFGSSISVNGDIEIQGNLNLTGATGNASITLSGNSNQTITKTSGSFTTGHYIINKTGGTVTLGSAMALSAVGQDLSLLSGTLDLAGYSMSVSNSSGTDNVLTLGAGTVINRNGGTLTYESLNDLGGTINP